MKKSLAVLLLVVALIGCGDSNSTAAKTEAQQLKERIASLEKKLAAKQKPDSEADAIPEAEEKRRAAVEEREKAANINKTPILPNRVVNHQLAVVLNQPEIELKIF